MFVGPQNRTSGKPAPAVFPEIRNTQEDIQMAETVKKAKAPAKPRKGSTTTTTTAGKKANGSAEPFKMPTPSHDEIAQLARKYWAERGYTDGSHEEDWFRAEQELRAKAS
jgi:hypothetical protein